jgi:predicted nucleic-acid-binding protein
VIGLDTNVLVRYVTQDEQTQSSIVNKLMKEAEEKNQFLWISLITICELVWVLESCYNQSKEQIIEVLNTLLQITQIKIEHQAVVYEALIDFNKHKNIDFSGCLIGRHNQTNECIHTFTFDKSAAKLQTFELLH